MPHRVPECTNRKLLDKCCKNVLCHGGHRQSGLTNFRYSSALSFNSIIIGPLIASLPAKEDWPYLSMSSACASMKVARNSARIRAQRLGYPDFYNIISQIMPTTVQRAFQMGNTLLSGSSDTLIVLAVVLLAAATTCCSAATCTSSTVEALLEFQSAFRDPIGTVFFSWDTTADCCTWAGITCQNGALVALDVEGPLTSNRSYTGSKPGHTLSKLKDLETLKLKSLQFNSKIPSQWSSFSDNLVAITVNDCDLQDSIPAGLANNSRLQTLDLMSNNLSGEIPSQLCNLHYLKYLDLSYNTLDTDAVPECITNRGSITNVNYGHQSTNNSEIDGDGEGEGRRRGSPYSAYNGATSFFQSNAMVLLLPLFLSLLQHHCLV